MPLCLEHTLTRADVGGGEPALSYVENQTSLEVYLFRAQAKRGIFVVLMFVS